MVLVWHMPSRMVLSQCLSFARPTVCGARGAAFSPAGNRASSRPRGCNRPAGTVLRCTNERLVHAGKTSPKTLNLDVCVSLR
jgi:hypothetical protein